MPKLEDIFSEVSSTTARFITYKFKLYSDADKKKNYIMPPKKIMGDDMEDFEANDLPSILKGLLKTHGRISVKKTYRNAIGRCEGRTIVKIQPKG